MLVVQAATLLSPGAKSMLQEWMVMDVAKLTWDAVGAVGMERRLAAGAWSRCLRNDVSAGRDGGSYRRRVSWVLVVLVWRCHARVPNVLGSFLKFLMSARTLVAGLSPRDRANIRNMSETVVCC